MKKIKIFQLKDTEEACKYLFMGLNYTRNHGGVNLNNYEEIYSCERHDNYDLEDAFYEFNMDRPDDFTGHSLSVSDIVEVDGKKYFCDNMGWIELW